MMQHNWIFQLASEPTADAQASILQELTAFVANWKAHGSPVLGRAELRHGRFVVVMAEPGHASGCSIDAMNKGVADILTRHDIALLGPEHVFFRDSDGSLAHIDFKEVRAAILAGRLQAQTIVFDATMGQSNDLACWEVPLEQTWMARFIAQKA
jgi:hypothetical protein